MEKDFTDEEFIFLVDCSLPMGSFEFKLTTQCLILFIKSLPENSYFNVISFGTEFSPLFERPVQYTNENAQKAIKFAETLEIILGGADLLSPLKYVFSKPLSKPGKLRRIYVLTYGSVSDTKVVISIVESYNDTTMSNSIGIGFSANKELVEGIARNGNGVFDFVNYSYDMRPKVINQLSKSMNGLCHVEISFENNDSVEIVPPLTKLSPEIPNTFYFKSSRLSDSNHICIEFAGKREPIIVQLNSIENNSKVEKSFEYLFYNENIKSLYNVLQTKQVVNKIKQLSVEY